MTPRFELIFMSKGVRCSHDENWRRAFVMSVLHDMRAEQVVLPVHFCVISDTYRERARAQVAVRISDATLEKLAAYCRDSDATMVLVPCSRPDLCEDGTALTHMLVCSERADEAALEPDR